MLRDQSIGPCMPPSEYYILGAKEGRIQANEMVKTVRKCEDMEQVSLLAGKILSIFRETSKEFYSQEPKFSEGFWESFMERAQELRATQ